LYKSSELLRCIFLFQAEDGIRDRNVTGVQTCALPIFNNIPTEEVMDHLYKIIDKYNLKDESVKLNTIEDEDDFFFLMSFFNAQRSEERRVGKDCRSRWGGGD